MSERPEVVTVERVIPAPPEAVFDLLADPDRHHDIDGSGTVVKAKQGSQRLVLGSRFGMSMKVGIPYSMVSTVIELDEPWRIAWQTRGPGNLGGGRIWRYELEPTDDGATLVRESYDVHWIPTWARIVDVPTNRAKELREGMRHTLSRLKAAAEASTDADAG